MQNCFSDEATTPTSSQILPINVRFESFDICSSVNDSNFQEIDLNDNVVTDEVALIRLESTALNPDNVYEPTPQFTKCCLSFTIHGKQNEVLDSIFLLHLFLLSSNEFRSFKTNFGRN